MAKNDQKESAQYKKVIEGFGFEKLMVLLERLKDSPSGSILYQHIERLIKETEYTHSKITLAYASLVVNLIETHRKQLPPGSRLYFELQIVQQRLTPPISLREMASLHTYMNNVASVLTKIRSVNQDSIRNAIAPLLDDPEPVEQPATEVEPSPIQSPAAEKEKAKQAAAVEQQVTSVYRDRLDKQRVEMEQIRQALAEKVDEASHQQKKVANSLASLLTKLAKTGQTEADGIRQQLVGDVDELVSAQNLLTTVLSDSRSLLSKVDDSNQQLRNELSHVHVLSLTDELTQLPNRRAFLRKLEEEIERSQRDRSALTLGMLDLDHFKTMNDRYGHNIGDEILRTYTLDILSMFRRYDMVARYGGEEFGILLPGTNQEGAICAFEKVREKAAETYFVCEGVKTPVPTFSAGLAIYTEGESVEGFIGRADRALYKAKQTGRDKIVVNEKPVSQRGGETGDSVEKEKAKEKGDGGFKE